MADTKLAKVGITLKERWAANISYEPLDFALWRTQDGGDGRGYIAKKSNINVLPTDDTVWIPATEAGQSIYDLAVRYGKFVGTEEEFVQEYYDAIHDAQNAAAGAEATNTEVQEAENLRKSAENARVEAETARETHETARMDAESNRVAAENQRANAEVQRNSQETARQSAENARQTAEQGRQTAEQGRQSAETARENAEHERRADFEALETDMQNAIHQADEATHEASQINNEVKHDEQLRQQAEQGRVEAEQGRVQQESARQTSESARQAAEINRSNAEANRRNAETAREEAESSRRSAEQGRESAESQRAENESTRQSNESSRQSAETARSEAEQARQGAESTRESNEQTRQSQEGARQSAEQTRAQNEQTRQTQEGSRQTAETARANAESARATAENARKTAETGRVNAETARVNAETARVAAETARETQATSDHQRAESDHAIAAEDHATLDEKISHKADIDGSYDSMAVGLAKNLEGRTNVTGSFFKRTTGGDAEVANGTAQLNEVNGKSQVWNQMVKTLENAEVKPVPRDNDFTYNGPVATASFWNKQGPFRFNIGFSGRYGHKMFFRVEHYNDDNYALALQFGSNNNNVNCGKVARIVSFPSSSSALYNDYVSLYSGSYNLTNVVVKNLIVLDLTLLGIDNLTTVEEVEAWLAENIGEQAYYPYNPGEVLNNRMKGVESIGFNLLDPATGKADIIGAYSDVYGNYYGITGTHGALTFTDKFGNTETITPDEDGKFLLETAGTLSVADAGEDCAVFLWWDGTQTEYKPYEKNVGALDVTHIYGKLNGEGEYVRVWPTGMPGIGDIKDSLKVVDGQVVAERKVGEVDLGTLTYSLSSDIFFPAPLDGMSTESDVNGVLCGKYKPRNNRAVKEDKAMYRANGRPFFQDSACADAASFKSSNAGVLLYYELETPRIFTDLIYRDSESFADNTPVTLPVNYKVDNWGIERIAPQNTEEAVLTTKPELTMRYSIDAVEELNTHRDEIDDLYEKNEELDQRKPEKYGEYPDMAVGSAKNIAGDLATDAEFKFRKTGGNDAVASGLAKLTAVYGKSLVWNQLARNGNFAEGGNTPTSWLIGYNTVVDNSNSAYIEFNREDGDASLRLPTAEPLVYGHKYLVSCRFRRKEAGEGTCYVYCAPFFEGRTKSCPTDGSWYYLKEIYTENNSQLDGTDSTYGVFRFLSSVPCQIDKKVGVMLIDLTLMFGAGNEPATVEEFEAMFPLPYYDYNAGEIVSNKATALEAVGFNQWDEEWELGGINTTTGANLNSTDQIRSKNYIPIFGGVKYYIQTPRKNTNPEITWCIFFDADKQVIDATGVPEKISTSGNSVCLRAEFTAPSGAKYMRFYMLSTYGAAYTNDICLNLSDPSRNGSYEPYRKYTLPLNIPTLTGKLNGEGESVVVCPEGLKSAGSARDELVIKNGYATSVIKRVGMVDLGSLNWVVDGVFRTDDLASTAKRGTSSVLTGQINTKGYESIYNINSATDKQIALNSSAHTTGRTFLKDTDYSTAADFKTAMSGVMLYYELATPEEYILDEPFYVGYQEDANGTEKRLPEDTAESVMPALPCKVAYPIDVVKAINELGNTYVPRSEWAKWGVVSQTQTWSGSGSNPRTYAMSNKVMGWIPNSNIDLYEAAGAVYNPTTGYFELNGLTDISYAEMREIYSYTIDFTMHRTSRNGNFSCLYARTLIPQKIASTIITADYGWAFYNSRFEVIPALDRINSLSQAFRADDKLKVILGEMEVVGVGTTAGFSSAFLNCFTLETIKLKGIKVTTDSLAPCVSLSLASVVYMVQNCGTIPEAGITITLHATAYARCVADTTEYTYNSQTYTGIIALAAAKNITIQSA